MEQFEPIGKSNLSKPAPANKQTGSSDMAKTRPDFENTAGFRLAEKILDRSKALDPSLACQLPRKVAPVKPLDHSHKRSPVFAIVLLVALPVVAYLGYVTYRTYHELPIYFILPVLGGLAVLAVGAVIQRPPACNCQPEMNLVATGTAVIGQVTEKVQITDEKGQTVYGFEYAFQTKGSEESQWAHDKVDKATFDSLDEGDDVTILYCEADGKLTSRLYQSCTYRAVPKE